MASPRADPLALRLAKEAVLRALDLPLDDGIRLEHDLYVLLQTTADRRGGRAVVPRAPAATLRRTLGGRRFMPSQIGKIYLCASCGAQIIVTKGGSGTLRCCGAEMQQKK